MQLSGTVAAGAVGEAGAAGCAAGLGAGAPAQPARHAAAARVVAMLPAGRVIVEGEVME
jgi:hypothetical protein